MGPFEWRNGWATMLVGALVVTLPMEAAEDETKGPANAKARTPIVVTPAARALHAEALVADGHNDLPWELREYLRQGQLLDITQREKKLHTDIPRLREGGLGWQFWSAYVPVETAKNKTAVRLTLEQIELIHSIVESHPAVFAMARTSEDVVRLRAEGKIASMIGVEGGHSIDNSLDLLRLYYRLGVRYMTLTHSENTDWADAATDKAVHDGLAPFGVEIVRDMNRLGMLVDISHVSPATMHDVLDVTQAPVIASHSSAYSIANHRRNVPDDVLKRLKTNGGVVMVNFFSGFIVPEGARATADMFEASRRLRAQFPSDEPYKAAMKQWVAEHPVPRGTIHHLLDHIDHIVAIAGDDHVGLGSDFDGVTRLPTQLDDVSTYPNITQGLLDRGYSPESIKKILGGNILRVLREAERVARSWKLAPSRATFTSKTSPEKKKAGPVTK